VTRPISSRTQAAIDEAMAASRHEDVIEGVKAAVHRELLDLDPKSKVEDTKYFSHSFVPDFVVSWSDAGRAGRRDVYLRPSLASTLAAQDVQSLGDHSPVLLSLHRPEEPSLEEAARRDVGEHAPDTLVTGVSALDAFTGDPAADEPLQALVRPNLVRGGRGVISGSTLTALHAPLTGGPEDVSRLEAFGALVRQAFVPDAATRLERAAQILEIGLTGDIAALTPGLDVDPREELLRGRLSDVEMQVLLPYLLGRPDVTREPAFWTHVGSMLDLARLEGMFDVLGGLNLTPLVEPNLSRWEATRAALVATGDPGEDQPSVIWRAMGRTLAINLGEWRLHVTADKRRLPGREDSLQARWDDLVPVLRGRPVTAVALNGIQRRVNVNADQAADVFGDVAAIRQSIQDDFFVPTVTVRPSFDDDAAEVTVDFTRMLATASPPARVSDLAEIAAALLGHRVPIPGEELIDALGVTPPLPLQIDDAVEDAGARAIGGKGGVEAEESEN
jgi:hypothetical protein